jgi:hypothetical protein
MRLSKAATTYGDACANYALGANLATFEYNGKIYAFNAQFYFGKYVDDKTDPSAPLRYRNNVNQLIYRLYVSAPSNPLQYTTTNMSNWIVDCTVDLTDVKIDGKGVKEILKSEEGARVEVQRQGSVFTISLNSQVIDTIDLAGSYLDSRGAFAYFDANTNATFGLSFDGAEAYYDNFSAVVEQ